MGAVVSRIQACWLLDIEANEIETTRLKRRVEKKVDGKSLSFLPSLLRPLATSEVCQLKTVGGGGVQRFQFLGSETLWKCVWRESRLVNNMYMGEMYNKAWAYLDDGNLEEPGWNFDVLRKRESFFRKKVCEEEVFSRAGRRRDVRKEESGR